MAKDRYIYPAIFDYDDDGIAVEFSDLPGCFTCGDNDEEALHMAKEAMLYQVPGSLRKSVVKNVFFEYTA